MSKAPILTVMKDGEVIKTLPIEGDTVLGRGQECNIWLNDRSISRQHAIFKVTSGNIQVDKKSEFGALSVNGAETTRAILKEGDIVSIGPYLIRISGAQNQSQTTSNPQPVSPVEPPAEVLSIPNPKESSKLQSLIPEQPNLNENQNISEPPAENAPFQSFDINASPEIEQIPDTAPEENNNDLPELSLEPIDEDGQTKITPMGKLSVKLTFAPGTANYTEYDFTTDEITIGRGQDCDIILNDKKSSRKNSIIKRAGLSFIIKDLDSANGTSVNGTKITEQELNSDDVIKIGATEFQFKAVSAEFLEQAKNFTTLPPESIDDSLSSGDPFGIEGLDPALAQGEQIQQDQVLNGVPAAPNAVLEGENPAAQPGNFELAVPGINETSGIPGITGLPGASTQKKSIIDKFKSLSRRKQIIVILLVMAFVWASMDDDAPVIKKSPKKSPTPKPSIAEKVSTGVRSFESLSPEQQKFVQNQHLQAFDHYKNRNYEAALYEIQKIFELVPDYKDSRELERYAKEGKLRVDAKKAEDDRKDQEEKHKKKIAQLIEEAKNLMETKRYDEAREVFTQIIAEDPENTDVSTWRKEIEAHDEEIRIQEQQKQVQQDINKRGWDLFQEAADLKKQKKYHSAIKSFQSVLDIGASDPDLIKQAKKMQAQSYAAIRNQRDPVLKKAKESEGAGEFTKAFQLYKKATKIDPPHPAGYAGMNRIRGILHDRAKAFYTDAIIAESFSDFAKAKQLFEECLKIAPIDDIYHERAERKLSLYYFQKEEQPQP